MEKIQFKSTINAPKEKVWETLWELDSYRKWTSVFSESSTVETDNWKEGSKILFLDGKGNGMVSKISANKPNEQMTFTHLGEVKDGVEDTTSDRVKAWAGSTESYSLKDAGGKTELTVVMDTNEEFKEFFSNTWPLAIEKIREAAEA